VKWQITCHSFAGFTFIELMLMTSMSTELSNGENMVSGKLESWLLQLNFYILALTRPTCWTKPHNFA